MKKSRIPSSVIKPVLEQLESRQLMAMTHQYTFNNGTANDSVGTAHGTLMNGASITDGWAWLENTGKLSNDAALEYINLPANILPSSGSASVMVWYTNSVVAPNFTRVFDFGDQVSGAGNSYFFYTPRSSSSDARAVIRAAGGTEKTATKSGGTFDGFAHTATAVIDSSAGFIRLYVDGALASSTALSGVSAASINNLQSFIGKSLFDVDPGFTGAIDELRIYNHALSATEVSQAYGAGAVRPVQTTPAKQIEKLNRGVVAIRTASTTAHISWRQLASDPIDIGFNLYQSVNGAAFTKVNSTVITTTSDYTQTGINPAVSNAYYVRTVINGAEQPASETFTMPANTPVQYFLNIPLNIPAGGTTPSGEAYTYTANDASVGDVDGDGEYEVIVKWEPTNAKDNSQSGYTGNVYLDCYKLNGTQLWRIDLGRNIRAGAHYTQFQVYDLDGDGKAEVACKTAPGTIDGLGNPVLMGSDVVTADYRNSGGYILSGPEYLTVFSGLTGANRSTVSYTVPRGTVSNWGDNYGNRVDRFLAGVAYLDGARPSLVMCRGYYTRTVLSAWDFRNGSLVQRWLFDTGNSTSGPLAGYRGQGAHSLSIGDVDGDGKDEIAYGAMAVDDNGTPRYTTGLGHGDATHMSDMDPIRPGLEFFMPHEGTGGNGNFGNSLRDAGSGAIIYKHPVVQNTDGSWPDVGRGVAADIDPNYLGYEFWDSYMGTLNDARGNPVYTKPGSMHQNFLVSWDADPLRETLDGTTIANYNYTTRGRSNYDLDPNTSGTQTAPGASSNNGTKSTPALTADMFGDWREETIWRRSDNTALMIFTTPFAAVNRMTTLMHDIQYRESVAWQNTAYNQPTHTSFYLGDSMPSVPRPLYFYAGETPALSAPSTLTATAVSTSQINLSWQDTNTEETGFEIQRSSDGTNFTTIASVGINVLSYNNIGLTSNTAYTYRVRAVGTINPSDYSNTVSATTHATSSGSISGMVYEDRDSSGTYNSADVAMLGVTVYLDTNNNGSLDTGEASAQSSSTGYSFTGLSAGIYRVREILPASMVRSQPTTEPYTLVVAGNAMTGNFGNIPLSFSGSTANESWYIKYQPISQKYEIWSNATPATQTTANYSLARTMIPSLTFNGMAGDDSLVIDNSLGDVVPAGGIVFNGGENSDSLEIRGTGSSDTYSLPAAGQILHGVESVNASVESLKLSTGIFNVSADLGAINLEATGSNTTVNLSETQTLNSLNVMAGATVVSSSTSATAPAMVISSVTLSSGKLVVAPNGNLSGVSQFKSLTMDSSARLELHDNDLLIDYTGGVSPYGAIKDLVQQGLALLGGSATSGIGSIAVDSPSSAGTMLAVVDNQLAGGSVTTLSGYQVVPAQSVLVKYTWLGDSNLSGDVDHNDYALIDTGFTSNNAAINWIFGDYDYNGAIDGNDYALIDTGFASQNAIL